MEAICSKKRSFLDDIDWNGERPLKQVVLIHKHEERSLFWHII